jgi:hypothetical protein
LYFSYLSITDEIIDTPVVSTIHPADKRIIIDKTTNKIQ